MNDIRKFFAFLSVVSFGFGLISIMVAYLLEFQARQELPPEMRTPEAIHKYYDGSVCLGCEAIGIALMISVSK